jgi:hypothetical protein
MSEAASFSYFLAIMTFDWLQFTVIATTPTPSISPWSSAGSWTTFAVTVVGLLYLYLKNSGGAGEQFLRRYFPLSVTVGWKFVLVMLIAYWVVPFALSSRGEVFTGWAGTVVFGVINLAMFWRIGYHLRLLAVGSPLNIQSEAAPGAAADRAGM